MGLLVIGGAFIFEPAKRTKDRKRMIWEKWGGTKKNGWFESQITCSVYVVHICVHYAVIFTNFPKKVIRKLYKIIGNGKKIQNNQLHRIWSLKRQFNHRFYPFDYAFVEWQKQIQLRTFPIIWFCYAALPLMAIHFRIAWTNQDCSHTTINFRTHVANVIFMYSSIVSIIIKMFDVEKITNNITIIKRFFVRFFLHSPLE